MRRPSPPGLLAVVALIVALSQPLVASAAGVAVSRPTLSKSTGITTSTKLTARGYAYPVPVSIRSSSATLVLSKRASSGAYVRVKSVRCTLKRSGLRVNYSAAFGPLSAGRYSTSVRFVWVGTDRKAHPSTSPGRLLTVTAPAMATTWNVIEKDFAFVPSALTIAVGDKVVFKNNDSVQHQVHIDGKNLTLQGAGESVTWIAPRSGTFPLSCVLHPSMTGQISVK